MMGKALRAAAAAYTSDTAFHFALLLAFGLLAMAVSLAAHPAAEVLANLG
jgi:hypothetical protein